MYTQHYHQLTLSRIFRVDSMQTLEVLCVGEKFPSHVIPIIGNVVCIGK